MLKGSGVRKMPNVTGSGVRKMTNVTGGLSGR